MYTMDLHGYNIEQFTEQIQHKTKYFSLSERRKVKIISELESICLSDLQCNIQNFYINIIDINFYIILFY